MARYGLIGKSLAHSFSARYFQEKFAREGLAHSYENFELTRIEDLSRLREQEPDLAGLNVTIPYKQAVIPYLNQMHPDAQDIGAVNTICIREGRWLGYNTDWLGFRDSLSPWLRPHHRSALVLGSGGASRAVQYALRQMGLAVFTISRHPQRQELSYRQAAQELSDHFILVNCTPLGTFPALDEQPPIDIKHLSSRHLVYDLIYNPPLTRLLRRSRAMGATVINGRDMLTRQAEKSWLLWNEL